MTANTLKDAFASQAISCAMLDSPFMEQLCNLFATRYADNDPLFDRLFSWEGDVSSAGESVPLRVCGALHALRLQGNNILEPVYPPNAVTDDELWAAVLAVMDQETTFIDDFINNPPQTNEVRRSVALITAGHLIHDRFNIPFRLSELGASAGLNLSWPEFALKCGGELLGPADSKVVLTPDWKGPIPPLATPMITERRGVDLNPLDRELDSLRLRAYLWPDQPERLRLTAAALECSSAPVDKQDGVEWLKERLFHTQGEGHMIYSTIAWQYFPKEARADGTALIEQAGKLAKESYPLIWFTMEADGQSPGAAMVMRYWPGDVTIPIGRVDFHGRWLRLDVGALS